VIALDPSGHWESGVFRTIQAASADFPDADLCLIDIPIGLAQEGVRECDVLARRLLGRRGVSVFTPPCRAALAARSYLEASAIHFKHCGRRITIQSWNIAAKIAEVDRFLRKTPSARGRMRESHPEVSFAALAGRPMLHPKKSREGFAQRLAVLRPFVPEAEQIVADALARYPRSILGRDDVLDALVLALSAALPPESLASLPALPLRDANGLPMEIVCPLYARK
jgi:predicted RNase H-like nuclease